jgi:hypothetical protein
MTQIKRSTGKYAMSVTVRRLRKNGWPENGQGSRIRGGSMKRQPFWCERPESGFCAKAKLERKKETDCTGCLYNFHSSIKGKKDDRNKPRMELLPYDVLVEVSKVLTHGAIKYEPDNWKKVPDAKNRYTGALMRHLSAWKSGEDIDSESGEDKLLHIAQVACNALFLVWFSLHEENGMKKDMKYESWSIYNDYGKRSDRRC